MATCRSWCRSTPSRSKRVSGRDPQVDVEVAVAAPAAPGHAPTGEAQRRAVVDAAGDLDQKRLLLGAPPLAPAVRAGGGDLLAGAAAAGAGVRGDHLAEDRLADPTYLAAAAAHRAAGGRGADPGPRTARRWRRRSAGGRTAPSPTPKTASVNSRSMTDSASSPGRWTAPRPGPAPEGAGPAEEGVEEVAETAPTRTRRRVRRHPRRPSRGRPRGRTCRSGDGARGPAAPRRRG